MSFCEYANFVLYHSLFHSVRYSLIGWISAYLLFFITLPRRLPEKQSARIEMYLQRAGNEHSGHWPQVSFAVLFKSLIMHTHTFFGLLAIPYSIYWHLKLLNQNLRFLWLLFKGPGFISCEYWAGRCRSFRVKIKLWKIHLHPFEDSHINKISLMCM